MNNSFTICFYGSSDDQLEEKLATQYSTDIEIFVETILKLEHNNIKIITGGYGGIMDLIAKTFQSKKQQCPNKTIEVIGITCDAYEIEDPSNANYNVSNDYSKHNDAFIQATDFADRIQSMIELSDLFIVLPGKQGSLAELLLTYDTYKNGEYILKGKKTKILVHKYWKSLLQKDFFRPFDTNILQYFDNDSFEGQLNNILKKNKTKNSDILNNIETNNLDDVKKQDYYKIKFEKLTEEINKTILGRKYDSTNNILGFDFGWIIKTKGNCIEGSFLSFSTTKYNDLLKNYFTNHNSLMLNAFENDFKSSFINGMLEPTQIIKFDDHNTIPNQDTSKQNANFNDLVDHFNKNCYGQTLIWKGFKVKNLEDENIGTEIIYSVFLLLNIKIPSTKLNKIRQLIDDFLLILSSTKSGEIFKEKEKDILKQALRAAISQVMARNGSHNIGSHVLNQLVRGLKDIDFNNQNYINSIFSLNYHHKDLINCFDSEKPIPKCSDLAFAQLEFFNGYIKNRMEYLGDLAMNTPKMSSSLYLISDIFIDFDKVRLLLNNISGLGANFIYEIQFIIKGEKITKDNYNDIDIKLAIANDITGCQAVYNILENIIRNTAKHSKRESNENVIFTIDVIDIDTDYYQINIYDNVKKDDIDDKVNNQNDKLNKDVLDNVSNALRQGSLGMIEMDASAAYLRMLDITMINDDDYEIDLTPDKNNKYKTKGPELPILNANKFPLKEGDEAKCLGYQFYIPKPKEFLFITDNDSKNKYEDLKKLKSEGVDIMSFDDFKGNLIKDITFPHQFIITEFKFEKDIKKRKAQYSPRVIEFTDCLLKNTFNELEKEVWKKYIKEKLSYKNFCINLDNFDLNNIHPTFVFNDHSFTKCKVLNKVETLKCDDSLFISFEVLSSFAQNKLPNFNKSSNLINYKEKLDSDLILRLKIGESSKNRILLIDERIQEFSVKNYEYYGKNSEGINNYVQNTISNYALYQAMNVFLPSKEGILEMNNLYPTFNYDLSSKTFSKKWFVGKILVFLNNEKVDFLVIHYSILERVFGDKKNEDINDFLKDLNCKYNNLEIVITSGRTRINGLPKFVRFLNLAPLLTAFIDTRSKYSINKILNDSRI